MNEIPALLAAMHLASPALPVGGFSYSGGLEAAHAAGLVADASSAQEWIQAVLSDALERAEAPMWLLQYRAWRAGDWAAAEHWNTWFLAARDSLELRLETEQMGWSMVRLIEALSLGQDPARKALLALTPIGYPTACAFAYWAQGVSEDAGLAAYCFAFLENQVAAALKIIPLGQIAAQRVLTALMAELPALLERARERALAEPARIETFLPQLAILSARHESQYSRLFRS